jgi:hypothetical protein
MGCVAKASCGEAEGKIGSLIFNCNRTTFAELT